jgi:hypothetical protein
MDPAERVERLALLVVLFVVSTVLVGQGILNSLVHWPEWVRIVVGLIASAILLELFIKCCYLAINASEFVARMYWGSNRYFRGYWHYTSELDGQRYVGVWKFDQTATDCRLFAFGLNRSFERRFISHSIGSITEMDGSSGVYQVALMRRDFDEGEILMFTLNRFQPDRPERIRWYLCAPRRMSGDTFTIGGRFSGTASRNVTVVRHPDIKSDLQMIERLREINPFNSATSPD